MKLKYFIVALLLFAAIAMPAVSAVRYDTTNTLTMTIFNWGQGDTAHFKDQRTVTFDRLADGRRISQVQFSVPSGAQIDLIIYYGANLTVTGSTENHVVSSIGPIKRTQSTITLNGVSKTYDFLDSAPSYDVNFAGYAKDNNATSDGTNTGFLIYSGGYGGYDNDLAVFYEVDNLAANTIYQIDATCPEPFEMWVTTYPAAAVSAGAGKSAIDAGWELVNLAISMVSMVAGIIIQIIKWGKFFFIDNLQMTIALYITLTMAFAARKSRGNMEKFFRTFFSDQRKLFEFIMALWQYAVSILSQLRSIFKLV